MADFEAEADEPERVTVEPREAVRLFGHLCEPDDDAQVPAPAPIVAALCGLLRR